MMEAWKFYFCKQRKFKKILANESHDKSGFTKSKLETWTDYVHVDDDTRQIYVVCR